MKRKKIAIQLTDKALISMKKKGAKNGRSRKAQIELIIEEEAKK